MRRYALFSLLFLTCLASRSGGQTISAPSAPNDSIFRRARRMVGEGNGTLGRALVDSVLKRAEEGTTAYGDALYWHGALAETAADAERDYRRVIVEYPLSHYADDALLAIVELEQARGDRAGALAHLQRFVREHPASPARGVAALAAARLAFEQRDTRAGCSLISDARNSAPAADIELRNQIDYFGSRCAGVTADASAPATTTTPPVPARDSALAAPAPKRGVAEAPTSVAQVPAPAASPARPAATVSPKAQPKQPSVKTVASEPAPAPAITPKTESTTKARGIYTIQLAAYGTRADADALVAKLSARGVKARVSGKAKPFRVRLSFYSSRQAALDEVASLKQRGIIGFVTEEPEGRSP